MENNFNNLSAKELLEFQLSRKIINLYKSFLEILEDLEVDGYDIPKEKLSRYRKKILDNGNNTIREINGNLEKMEIRLK